MNEERTLKIEITESGLLNIDPGQLTVVEVMGALEVAQRIYGLQAIRQHDHG